MLFWAININININCIHVSHVGNPGENHGSYLYKLFTMTAKAFG